MRAEACKISQFPPKIILQNWLFLWLCYNIPKLIVVLYHIVCDVTIRDCGEVPTGAFNLYAFCTTIVFQAIFVVAFRFNHKVDVLNVASLMEYHSSVGIIGPTFLLLYLSASNHKLTLDILCQLSLQSCIFQKRPINQSTIVTYQQPFSTLSTMWQK